MKSEKGDGGVGYNGEHAFEHYGKWGSSATGNAHSGEVIPAAMNAFLRFQMTPATAPNVTPYS
jgi:hypothetical protein